MLEEPDLASRFDGIKEEPEAGDGKKTCRQKKEAKNVVARNRFSRPRRQIAHECCRPTRPKVSSSMLMTSLVVASRAFRIRLYPFPNIVCCWLWSGWREPRL